MSDAKAVSRQLVVRNEKGLHARPATQIAKLAASFDAEVFIQRDAQRVNAKSVISLLILAASCDTTVTVEAIGPESEQVLDALHALFENRFNEER